MSELPRTFPLAPQQSRLWRSIEVHGAAPFASHALIDLAWDRDPQLLFDLVQRCRRRHVALNLEIAASPAGGVAQRIAPEGPARCDARPEVIRGTTPQALWTRRTLAAHAAALNPRAADACLLVTLLRFDAGRVRLCVSAPALFVDRRSMSLLAEEIAAAVDGREPNQTQRIPFDSLCRWYAEIRAGPEAAAGREFWRALNAVDSGPAGSHPEFDEGNADSRPRYARLAPGDDAVAMLQDHGAADHDGLADVCAAAFAVTLGRTFGAEQVALARELSGRHLQALQSCVGALASTVSFPFDLSANPAFETLVARHAATRREAQDWLELFEPDPDATGEARGRFLFESYSSAAGEQPADVASCAALFAFKLELAETAGSRRLFLHYDETLCSHGFAARLLDACCTCVSAALARPECNIDALPVIGGAEACRQMKIFTGPVRAPESARAWLASRLRDVAEHAADGIAVEQPQSGSPGPALTYRQLFDRVGSIASRLRRTCPTGNARIGVLLDRSADAVAACLAIYLAGHACLPLEPGWPARRIDRVLRAAGVAAVLTTSDRSPALGEHRQRCIFMEDLPGGDPGASLPDGPRAEGSAYLIATSGTTGRPKLVQVPRTAFANQLRWFLAAFEPGEGSRFLQRTPLGFDASIWELWAPILSGGTLVIAPRAAENDLALLLELVAQQRIDVLQLVPAMLGAIGSWLAARPRDRSLCELKHLFVGGEPLTEAKLAGLRLAPATAVHNLYGPSEACIQVAAWQRGLARPQSAPIGRPIDNSRVYVLDPNLAPLPQGATGEICIAGVCLATGYAGAPGATAAAFVPDPHGAPGTRLYRSGDLGRIGVDGQLECLGRRDTQYKINGCRIEAGEIETEVEAFSAVEACCVYAAQGTHLTALVALRAAGSAPSTLAADIRARLEAVLPPFVLPVRIEFVEQALYHPNGKLDRSGMLRAYRDRHPDTAGAEVLTGRQPVTVAQRTIAAIWCELLDLDTVDVDTEFFSLGGHSLIFVQVVNRIRSEFGMEIPLRMIFENPTIAMLADQVDGRSPAGQPDRGTAARAGLPPS